MVTGQKDGQDDLLVSTASIKRICLSLFLSQKSFQEIDHRHTAHYNGTEMRTQNQDGLVTEAGTCGQDCIQSSLLQLSSPSETAGLGKRLSPYQKAEYKNNFFKK